MIKKFFIALVLLILAASANAVVLHGNSNMSSILTFEPSKTTNFAQSSTSVIRPSSQHNQSSLAGSGRYFVVLSEKSKTFFNHETKNMDSTKQEHVSNAGGVPAPAALHLAATVLGIYGIARRRRTFK